MDIPNNVVVLNPLPNTNSLSPVIPNGVGSTYRFETEAMSISGNYRKEESVHASGNWLTSQIGGSSNEVDRLTGTSRLTEGNYDLLLGYFDENDGVATAEVRVNGQLRGTLNFNERTPSNTDGSQTRRTKAIATGVALKPGDVIEITGRENSDEHSRIDFLDFVFKGGNSSPPNPTSTVRIEAERMNKSGYTTENNSLGSGGAFVQIPNAENSTGRVSDTFSGATGNYKVVIGYVDENDGTGRIETRIGGQTIATTNLNQHLGSSVITQGTVVRKEIATNIRIEQGASVELLGFANNREHARIDYIEFIPANGGGDPGGNPSDVTRPTANLSTGNITSASSNANAHTFTVSYSDNTGIKDSTIGNGDVRITGPNGFNQAATLISINGSGSRRTATYRINAPGGSWDSADNGSYNISMQSGEVEDTSGNSVSAGTIGAFDVSVGTSGGGNPNPGNGIAPPAGWGAIGISTGRTLYVSPNGSDSNSGTSAGSAFRSASKALSMVRPGETIVFAAGNYPPLSINGRNGSSGAPITIKASGNAVFSSGRYDAGAGITINNSSHLIIDGLTATRSLFGIMGERIKNISIVNSHVHNIGQEAIHVRQQSSYVLIGQNEIHDTGKRGGTYARYGEGIYIGFGASGGENDGSHHIVAHGNEIYRTSAEAIDMKRGLHNIIAEYNNIHDVNSKVRATINVMDGPTGRETGYIVRGNIIRNIAGDWYNSDGVGIRIFGGGVDVYNNVISNAEFSGIRNEANRGGAVRIYNNTVYNGGSRGDIVDETGKADIRNNIGSSRSGNITSSSSLFVNAAAGDLRLRSSASAAIDRGSNLSLVAIDMTGKARGDGGDTYDMGAYDQH